MTDPSNGTSFEQVTLPFGTALESESSGQTNRRFTSYDRSTTTKLDYAVNRHYDPQQGRFTQVDPLGMRSVRLGSPQSFNRYAYTQNDPVNHTDPSGLEMSAFCGAEFSFSDCGGGGGFWGGSFGGDVARYNREYGGLPPNIASAMAGYNQRVQNSLDANRANAAYHQALQSGRPEDMARALAMIKANPTLQLVAVLSEGQTKALAWISLLFGQAVGDQVRFDVVANLTGLSDYINSYTYNSTDRTFSVDFKPNVEDFLATSPYFAGPGIAFR